MPERVVAQLESVVREPLHLLEAPLALLPLELGGVAEEVVACRAAIQHAEGGFALPLGVGLREGQPDADATGGVDLELSVLLDVAELAGGRVVEDEDHR